jgi:putative spermidine/putrescine transport system substrate-binding protein
MPTATKALRRRTLLKSAAAVAGAAAGSGTITGFPFIWAQNIKDVVLNHAGPPVTAIPLIAAQATKDLGFTIHMQATENAAMLNRFISEPQSMDVADAALTNLPYLIGRNTLQSIPLAKFKNWDATMPIFTKGEYPDGRKVSAEGTAPINVLFSTGPDAEKSAGKPTDWLHGVPAVINGDTLGMRPDLIKRPVTTWADLISPDFKGKAALQDQPTVGIIDVAMAVSAAGNVKYGNKGNMTRAEIDKTINHMMELKRDGQFRSFWTTFDQSVNLMASGEVVIQSMWSPAVTAVRTRGIPCVFQPLKEGYRGWGYVLSIMKHVSGLKRDCAYEYMNWYTSGFEGAVIAREGYYSAQPENARKFLTPAEYDYWYGGKHAATDIYNPFGKLVEHAGRVRDGGSIWHRLGNIAVWNSVMDEDRYLTRRWNQFIGA